MKKLILLLIVVSVVGACRYRTGSGNIITEKRNTGTFTGISVGGGFEVEIKTGPIEVTIESDDNIMKYIKTDVVDGELKIRLDHVSLHDAHLKVYIKAPEINNIKASAGADIIAKDVLKSAQAIHLTVSSGSSIKAGLDAPDVFANVSSGADMDLKGHTKNFNTESSSGSTINAKELLSENTTVRVSSGASAHVHASVNLDAKASSGGNVRYSGNPSISKDVNSGGEVEKE